MQFHGCSFIETISPGKEARKASDALNSYVIVVPAQSLPSRRRGREPRYIEAFWMPAYAGMTALQCILGDLTSG